MIDVKEPRPSWLVAGVEPKQVALDHIRKQAEQAIKKVSQPAGLCHSLCFSSYLQSPTSWFCLEFLARFPSVMPCAVEL